MSSTLATLILAICQAQSWCLQQDLGNASIFRKSRWKQEAQQFVIGLLKGFSTHWLNFCKKKCRYLPYSHQYLYFVLIGPPLLILVNFEVENLAYILVCMQWTDFCWATSFYSYFLSYITFYSVSGALLLFVSVRVLESHWQDVQSHPHPTMVYLACPPGPAIFPSQQHCGCSSVPNRTKGRRRVLKAAWWHSIFF
uniref:Uncharacterized protein n=1 Tax=Castor canadensis TaxID=51338 RepID=A0A8C0WVH4_CASCN